MIQTQNSPRVSIGMPVYNGERYIAETLDSLLAQTYEDFELIICDNASSDRTEQICRAYADKDKRIRYVRNATNLGAAKNYRRAFELSTAKYFRWANCDDLFGSTSLARCVEVLEQEPSVVLTYPKTKLIDERGQFISEYDDNLHLQSPKASVRFMQLTQSLGLVNVIYGLMRSHIIKRTAMIGNFIASDRPFLAELSLYGRFCEIPEFLFYRRIHPDAYSSKKDSSQLLEFYDPATKYQIPLTRCRHLWENLVAVKRAPLDLAEKMHLYRYIARMGRWSRHEIINELNAALHRLMYRGKGLKTINL